MQGIPSINLLEAPFAKGSERSGGKSLRGVGGKGYSAKRNSNAFSGVNQKRITLLSEKEDSRDQEREATILWNWRRTHAGMRVSAN